MNAANDFDNSPVTVSDRAETRTSRNAPPPPASPSGDAAKTTSLIGMIVGIVGFLLSPFFGSGLLFSIAAIVLGYVGRKREPQARGFWLAALITGWIGFAIGVIFLVVGIAVIVAGLNDPSSTLNRR
jgi:hypothetical protein